MTVADLPEYLLIFAQKNFNDRYLKSDIVWNNDELPNEKNIKVLINDTRISTSLCFTDGEKVLLFDRDRSDLQNVKNMGWDCFGSVAFENASLKLKLGKESNFLFSIVNGIELIPGFVYEDNIDLLSKCSIKQTAIMFCFVVYVSPADLMKAVSSEVDNLKLFPINDTLSSTITLTAKADLSLGYLRGKHD